MQKTVIDCVGGEPNRFFMNYIGISNFIIENPNILNRISIINNIFDRFKNIGKKSYIEIDSTSLKSLIRFDYRMHYTNNENFNYESLEFAEKYLVEFGRFLDKMKSLGYANDSSCKAWSEVSNNNVDLYIKSMNNTIHHFSYMDLHVESLLVKSSSSILSFLEDEKSEEKSIFSVRYEELIDTLDEPLAKLDYRKEHGKICYVKSENYILDNIFSSKMLFAAIKLYIEMLENIPKFLGISYDIIPIEEIINEKAYVIKRNE